MIESGRARQPAPTTILAIAGGPIRIAVRSAASAPQPSCDIDRDLVRRARQRFARGLGLDLGSQGFADLEAALRVVRAFEDAAQRSPGVPS